MTFRVIRDYDLLSKTSLPESGIASDELPEYLGTVIHHKHYIVNTGEVENASRKTMPPDGVPLGMPDCVYKVIQYSSSEMQALTVPIRQELLIRDVVLAVYGYDVPGVDDEVARTL